ncbi:hypothetical protein EV384_3870 [Micromonospora kangleipakensis]|uniref:Uncharacterized protein n=1 Tax=Micromonospora kangleipakensis TaxID=1077942 RepID=A0A4Q8BDF7_9ACTN|nr:hypothetical protein EV384_3870 [Micromonospora kangleipakensis]
MRHAVDVACDVVSRQYFRTAGTRHVPSQDLYPVLIQIARTPVAGLRGVCPAEAGVGHRRRSGRRAAPRT